MPYNLSQNNTSKVIRYRLT